jgi:hypothetical protein
MAIIGTLPFNIQNGQPNDYGPLNSNLQFMISSVNSLAAGIQQANNFVAGQTIVGDTITTNAATQTLANKTLTAPLLLANPPGNDNSLLIPSTSWVVSLSLSSALPGQNAGTTGKVPISNGTVASWANEIQVSATSKTSGYTAAPGDQFVQDTSGGGFTVTLPSGSVGNAPILLHDLKGTFASNNLTVASSGGQLIMGLASPMICDINNVSIWLVYTGAAQGWRVM